jgi:hypothetical protein
VPGTSRIERRVSPFFGALGDLPDGALAHAEDEQVGLGVEQDERRTESDQ